MSLFQLFLNSVERAPDRPALWCDGQTLSYRALQVKASSLAAVLSRLTQPGDRCGIFAQRSITAYQGILATLQAGLCYVPLNKRFPAGRNAAMVSRAGAQILIVDRACDQDALQLLQASQEPLTVILPEHHLLPEGYERLEQHQIILQQELAGELAPRQGHYAYLLFTSGTTGEPKGVAVSDQQASAYIRRFLALYPFTEQDRFTQLFDLTFDLSVHDLFTCWGSGGCLYAIPEATVWNPFKFVAEHQLTVWFSVPSLLGMATRLRLLQPGLLPALRYSFFCGEALPGAVLKSWADSADNARLINLYGPTEATITISHYEIIREQWPDVDPVPLGEPYPGQGMVLAAEGDKQEAEHSGELWLQGDQLVEGYWQDPVRTAASFIEPDGQRFYATGDRVERSDQYGWLFKGRCDHQLKVNGFRVESSEIEALISHESGFWAVVIPIRRPVDSAITGLDVVIESPALVDEEKQRLLEHCRTHLPDYMVPKRCLCLPRLPRNSNGKVDRKQLEELIKSR